MSRLDRRAMFTSGAAAALLAATGGSLSAAPKRGGTLRLALPRDGQSQNRVLRGAIFDTLTEISPDGVLRGELASQWHSSMDARVWTFQLRGDALFHDGSRLTAADVMASLSAHRLPDGVDILGFLPLSETEFRLELAAPNPDFPYLLSNADLFIAKSGQVDVPLSQASGTGCYRLESLQDDRHFRLIRMAQHYKDGTAGWVDRVEGIVISDPAVRAEALRDGYVDVAAIPDPSGLLKRGSYQYHPSATEMALAARQEVGVPRKIGTRGSLDDGRLAERWWMV